MPTERPRRPWRRHLAFTALTGVVVAALGVGFFAGSLVASPEQVRASQEPPERTMLTATVRRGRLTSTVVFRARWTQGRTVTFSPATRGVVTSLPVAEGASVMAGTLLMTVNDRPVIALPGEVPLYRQLRRGDEGQDVERLQASLLAAGYSVWDRSGLFGAGTETALRDLYASVTMDLPMRATGRRGRRQPVASPDELHFVPHLPAMVGKVNARLGSPDLQDALILQSDRPRLRAMVNPVDAQQLRLGQQVTIDAPDGTTTLSGRIRSIGAARTDESRGRVVPVAIDPLKPIAADRTGTEMRVSASTLARSAGLFVPSSALQTAADGSVHVTVLEAARGRTVRVDVLGEANGRTSIRPVRGQLTRGDQVIVGLR